VSKYEKKTLIEARKLVARLVLNARIPGLKGHCWDIMPKMAARQVWHEAERSIYGCQYFSYEQAWAINATLTVEFTDGHRTISGKKVPTSVCHCKVNWSSTGRSLVEARAVVKLYSDLIDLGALIETHLNGLLIETTQEEFARYCEKQKEERKVELAEIRKEDRWKTGYTVEFTRKALKANKVPVEFYPEYEHKCGQVFCGGMTRANDPCVVKAKVLVWNEGLGRFLPRCNRHQKLSAPTENDKPAKEEAA